MTVIERLATSLKRKDEGPNLDLAAIIVQAADNRAIRELLQNLNHKNKGIQHDCIKAKCPNNQFPMYIENSTGVINDDNRTRFRDVATTRIDRLEKESQKKRVRKILKRMG